MKGKMPPKGMPAALDKGSRPPKGMAKKMGEGMPMMGGKHPMPEQHEKMPKGMKGGKK